MSVWSSNDLDIRYSPFNKQILIEQFSFFIAIQKRINVYTWNLHQMFISKFSIQATKYDSLTEL